MGVMVEQVVRKPEKMIVTVAVDGIEHPSSTDAPNEDTAALADLSGHTSS